MLWLMFKIEDKKISNQVKNIVEIRNLVVQNGKIFKDLKKTILNSIQSKP